MQFASFEFSPRKDDLMSQQPARKRFLRTLTAGGIALLLVTAVYAADKAGILFPDWSKPTKGSYGSPDSSIGKKPGEQQPWTVTTMASSIVGKPVSGRPVSLVGEVIDLSCYLQVGKHGDKHRDCGQKCARNGEPLGLLGEDGAVYMLIAEE